MSSRKVLFVVAFALIAAVGALWWASSEGSDDDATFVRIADANVAAPSADSANTSAVERSVVDARPDVAASSRDEASSAVLLVEVLRKEDGEPVSGVVVEAGSFGKDGASSCTTDTDGIARFEFEADVVVRQLRVARGESNTALREAGAWPCFRGVELATTLRVGRGATLSGVVVDDVGQPVANASVRWWRGAYAPDDRAPDGGVECDGAGRFSLDRLSEEFFVSASAPGLCCAWALSGEASDGEQLEGLPLTLAPCATILGHVEDDSGRALAGAQLRIGNSYSTNELRPTEHARVFQNPRFATTVVTDASGGFLVEGIAPADRKRNAWVQLEGCLGDNVWLDPAVSDNRVTLRRGIDIVGRVRARDGTPIEGASVRIGHVGGRVATPTTDADGAFVARGVEETDKGVLYVRRAGYSLFVGVGLAMRSASRPIEVVLEPAHRICGRVVDPDGRPACGMQVKLLGDRVFEVEGTRYGEPTTWEWAHDANECFSGPDGRFVFEDLYDGEFLVSARAPQDPGIYGDLRVRLAAGESPIEIVLGRSTATVAFEGVVLDAESGAPITRFDVCPMLADGDGGRGGRSESFASEDGAFRIAGLTAGEIELTARADGFAPWSAKPRDFEPGAYRVEVRMQRERSLDLRLVDASGELLPRDASVRFTNREGEMLMATSLASRSSLLNFQQGILRVTGLPSEVVKLSIDVSGASEPIDVEYDLAAPLVGMQDVVVDLSPPRSLDLVFFELPDDAGTPGVFAFEDVPAELGRRLKPWPNAVNVEPRNAAGKPLGSLSLRPEGEHFVAVSRRGATTFMGASDTPQARVELGPSARSLEITAEGCAPLTIELAQLSVEDPMRVVLLRKP